MPTFPDYTRDKEKDDQQFELSGATPNLTSSNTGSLNFRGGPEGRRAFNTGSGFQNLNRYLNTSGGKEFGQSFVNKVGQDVNKAETGINQVSDQFKNRANAYNPEIDVQGFIANPRHENAAAFQRELRGQYEGPRNLSESPELYNQLYGDINKAKSVTDLSQNQPGRFTLLKSYFGRPNYSHGQKYLDNFLLERGGFGNQLANLSKQSADQISRAAQQEKNIANFASRIQPQLDERSKAAREAIGIDRSGNITIGSGALGEIEDQIYRDLTSKNRETQEAKEQLQSGSVTPKYLERLGLQDRVNKPIYGVDLTNYLKETPVTRANVLSEDQRTRERALSDLAGLPYVEEPIIPLNSNQPFSYDLEGLNNAIKAQEDAYNSALKNDQVSVNYNKITEPGNINSQRYVTENIPLTKLREIIQNYEFRNQGKFPVGLSPREKQDLVNLKNILSEKESEIGNKYQKDRVLK